MPEGTVVIDAITSPVQTATPRFTGFVEPETALVAAFVINLANFESWYPAEDVVAGPEWAFNFQFVPPIDLDLTLVVPLNAIAAWLLWRRSAWGTVLGCVANVKGALYMPALAAATLTAGGAGADPSQAVLWLFLGAGCLAATVSLLTGSSQTRRNPMSE